MGMLFVFDAGYARSLRDGKGMLPREFLWQVPFLIFALAACVFVSGVSQEKLKRWAKPVWVFSLVALALAVIPNPLRSAEISGAHRWIKLGPLLLQPAEFAKIATILYLAAMLADRKAWPTKIKRRNWPQYMDSV